MAKMNVHNFNMAGAHVDTHVEGAGASDDDGAPPPLPAGGRVTVNPNDQGAGETSGSPSEADLMARKEFMRKAVPQGRVRKAEPWPQPKRGTRATPGESLSDRRWSLELAAFHAPPGATPEQILALARQFAAFLEGAPD